MIDQYGYSKDNPPENCIACRWHEVTYAPSTGCHMYWYDYCRNIRRAFGKLHVILRGEYRNMGNHDEDDMIKSQALPYECPFFSFTRVFWESYGRIKMDYEVFIFSCGSNPADWRGYYVYGLPEYISICTREISSTVQLHYLYVTSSDRSWFITSFGERSVLASAVSPTDWHFIPPY